ncbi:YidC/Oxa1 family insertase periplasmic-domain containing protein [Planctomycetota bacterium]
MKKGLILGVFAFVLGCAWLAGHTLLTAGAQPHAPCILLQTTTQAPPVTPASAPPTPQLDINPQVYYSAIGGPPETVIMGSSDPESEYRFELELDSQGAALRQATFNGRDFNNRNPNNPQPLIFLSPVPQRQGPAVMSMANRSLVLVDAMQQLRLDALSWATAGLQTEGDGTQRVRFEATVTGTNDTPVMHLMKTYTIHPDTHLLEWDLEVENLSPEAHEFYLNLIGPTGPGREAFRQDMRKTVVAYRDKQNQISIPKSAKRDINKLEKATDLEARTLIAKEANAPMAWMATSNKYFAAILVPKTQQEGEIARWVRYAAGAYYPLVDDEATVGLEIQTMPATLQPAGDDGSTQHYRFELYLGPKDKSKFDKNPYYKDLGFAYVIDFVGCCCPAGLIRPLAFFIMGVMKMIHVVIPNYGIAIIILVFLMRLIMHPITKKSQISMHRMSKMAPMAEQIKKKYANNKAEMNKQLMELYREQGASPVMSFLPMFFQMPIWIALWSAVNSSIDLRGAAFLPFWITDLSMPDALIPFTTALKVPLVGWKIQSLNALPLLMGVAFYMQQKLMPQQAAASSNPQMAQQQKMMMIMMPIMFPLMLYNVASGVNLYIMTSTFAGVLEQHIVRKHIREKEALESQNMVATTSKAGGKVKKKKPKPMFKNMR